MNFRYKWEFATTNLLLCNTNDWEQWNFRAVNNVVLHLKCSNSDEFYGKMFHTFWRIFEVFMMNKRWETGEHSLNGWLAVISHSDYAVFNVTIISNVMCRTLTGILALQHWEPTVAGAQNDIVQILQHLLCCAHVKQTLYQSIDKKAANYWKQKRVKWIRWMFGLN